ncbi:hypothetical protein BL253_28655 [Pseudofrankia asymbiotica]|uniref:Uncharacterized protein n=1 Tax=Pseudofrankia asymbiotica TaxID=1834516 RepID=A0A1V2I5M7_9ACTN|nr:hypothetical protein BL253_28655 [Pseudofrankia asymbiotica]
MSRGNAEFRTAGAAPDRADGQFISLLTAVGPQVVAADPTPPPRPRHRARAMARSASHSMGCPSAQPQPRPRPRLRAATPTGPAACCRWSARQLPWGEPTIMITSTGAIIGRVDLASELP